MLPLSAKSCCPLRWLLKCLRLSEALQPRRSILLGWGRRQLLYETLRVPAGFHDNRVPAGCLGDKGWASWCPRVPCGQAIAGNQRARGGTWIPQLRAASAPSWSQVPGWEAFLIPRPAQLKRWRLKTQLSNLSCSFCWFPAGRAGKLCVLGQSHERVTVWALRAQIFLWWFIIFIRNPRVTFCSTIFHHFQSAHYMHNLSESLGKEKTGI